MNRLHPGARWLFRLDSYFRFGIILFFLIYGLVFIFFVNNYSFLSFSLFFATLFIISLIISGEIYARLTYHNYFYEITKEGINLEYGIIWKKYIFIPYKRMQNIDIRRGIIARIFQFSTVEIETAGNSEMKNSKKRLYLRYKSEGHLPAIEIHKAEKIRETIMKKIKHNKNSAGLE